MGNRFVILMGTKKKDFTTQNVDLTMKHMLIGGLEHFYVP